MPEIVGVKLNKVQKISYFSPEKFILKEEQAVIVKTSRGIEFGIVKIPNKVLPEEKVKFELKPVLRIATEEDIKQNEENQKIKKQAEEVFKEKVKKHKLDMKLTNVELTFDLNKLIFYFTSEGRVDFRQFVKELATIFKMRIELRQIGVRDEAMVLNGIGICGRTLCCSTFLRKFQPVSIKMTKDQNLSLNPSKISGACGRLMCCLKYEQDSYEELNKNLPKEGDLVKTSLGEGYVMSVNVLRQVVKVAIIKNDNEDPKVEFFNVNEIKILKRKKFKEEKEENKDDLKSLEE